jgi:hypothetical protein
MQVFTKVAILILAIGLLAIPGLISVASVASSQDASLSTAPVYLTFKPNSVHNGEKYSLLITNKGSTKYVFNQGCFKETETINGHKRTFTECNKLSNNLAVNPGQTITKSSTFKCGMGTYYGYIVLWYVNTGSSYQSYSGKFSFHC